MTTPPTRSGARPWSTTWGSHRTRRNTPTRLLTSLLTQTGGDRSRVYFGGDGQVWLLNHTREETCPSIACPACATDHPAHAGAKK
jgi:hypothetical protein